MTSIHALHIPAGRRTVAVDVIGELARLEIRPAPGTRSEAPEGLPADVEEPLVVDVPARALVAAVRAAWADVHEPSGTFEPWRDARDPDDGYRRYRPYGLDDGPRPGDLGDGDPGGYHDGSVVPFPYRYPAGPPRPPRSGLPWDPEEEVTIRERWLAASPDADRTALLAEIAQAVERKVGGVAGRLPRVGCDPYRPGRPLRPWWEDAEDDRSDGEDAGAGSGAG